MDTDWAESESWCTCECREFNHQDTRGRNKHQGLMIRWELDHSKKWKHKLELLLDLLSVSFFTSHWCFCYIQLWFKLMVVVKSRSMAAWEREKSYVEGRLSQSQKWIGKLERESGGKSCLWRYISQHSTEKFAHPCLLQKHSKYQDIEVVSMRVKILVFFFSIKDTFFSTNGAGQNWWLHVEESK